jgi:ech hydrogenase subunit D
MNQQLIPIEKKELIAKVEAMRKDGFRLVQISCTLTDNFEITYSFDKEYQLTNVRCIFPKSDPTIDSITGLYLCAFTYENELQDLFGLTVKDMKLNFNGNFYQLSMKTPFNTISNAQSSQKPDQPTK